VTSSFRVITIAVV